MKKKLTALAAASLLLLSGCDDTSGKAEEGFTDQHNLDNNSYQTVIDKLKAKEGKTSEDYMALASAYMGKAGLSLSSTISIIAENSDEGSSKDEFAEFAEKVKERSTGSPILNTTDAIANYNSALYELKDAAFRAYLLADGNRTEVSCEKDEKYLNNAQKDVCLYLSVANLSKSAAIMANLSEDLSKLSDDTKQDSKLKASSCAMEYAYTGGTYDTKKCTVEVKDTIVFEASGRSYDRFAMRVEGASFDFLKTGSYTAMTDGYCTLNSFASRKDTEFTGSYVCPIVEDEKSEELTSLDGLLEVINGGLASIKVADDEEIKADVDEFREDIKGGSEDKSDVTRDELIEYLGNDKDEV